MISKAVEKHELQLELKKYVGNLKDLVKAKTRELEKSTKRFEDLFENAPDGIVISEMNGDILKANRAFYRMLHYPEDGSVKLNFVRDKLYANIPRIRPYHFQKTEGKGIFRRDGDEPDRLPRPAVPGHRLLYTRRFRRPALHRGGIQGYPPAQGTGTEADRAERKPGKNHPKKDGRPGEPEKPAGQQERRTRLADRKAEREQEQAADPFRRHHRPGRHDRPRIQHQDGQPQGGGRQRQVLRQDIQPGAALRKMPGSHGVPAKTLDHHGRKIRRRILPAAGLSDLRRPGRGGGRAGVLPPDHQAKEHGAATDADRQAGLAGPAGLGHRPRDQQPQHLHPRQRLDHPGGDEGHPAHSGRACPQTTRTCRSPA